MWLSSTVGPDRGASGAGLRCQLNDCDFDFACVGWGLFLFRNPGLETTLLDNFGTAFCTFQYGNVWILGFRDFQNEAPTSRLASRLEDQWDLCCAICHFLYFGLRNVFGLLDCWFLGLLVLYGGVGIYLDLS